MGNRWLRVLRHRWVDEGDTRRILGTEAMTRLAEKVRASEQRHLGEIRVCVEAGLPWSYLQRGAPARERAVMMFGKLRVWDTEANAGVLVYLLLADRAIEIVADRAVARVVPPARWQAIVEGLREALRAGRFEQGLADAIDAVDAVLVAAFPRGPDQPKQGNELPDSIVWRR